MKCFVLGEMFIDQYNKGFPTFVAKIILKRGDGVVVPGFVIVLFFFFCFLLIDGASKYQSQRQPLHIENFRV